MKKENRRALKPKDIERLTVLQFKHPGDLTEEEKVEMEKLQNLRAKFGEKK